MGVKRALQDVLKDAQILMSKSIRLTVGQALVRFVAKQYVERDGRQNRFIEGFWGIFGHGNVSGLGQGIVECAQEEGLRFYRPQHEQGMVHISAAFAKHRNRLSTFACTTSIGPGALNMVTGAGTKPSTFFLAAGGWNHCPRWMCVGYWVMRTWTASAIAFCFAGFVSRAN